MDRSVYKSDVANTDNIKSENIAKHLLTAIVTIATTVTCS